MKNLLILVRLGVCLLFCSLPLASQAGSAEHPAAKDAASKAAPPKKTWFYFRLWPDRLVKFDPATDRITARVRNKNGIAFRSILSNDHQHIFQVTGQKSVVEVVNLKHMEVEDEHSFKRDGALVRIESLLEFPGGKQWYVRVRVIKALPDRFQLQKPEWLLYNVEDHKILKHLAKLPKPLNEGTYASPDRKHWLVSSKDLVIVDPLTNREEGRIPLHRPLYPGMGPLRLRGRDLLAGQDPASIRMLYTMSDPQQKERSLLGIVDIDLLHRKIKALHELGWNPPVYRWRFTQDRKTAVGQSFSRRRSREGEDPEILLYTYDMQKGQLLRKSRQVIRNGLHLGAIAPDGSKLYLIGRGPEILIKDARHRTRKTLTLEAELDGSIIVVEE